jgi:hypothetical protein
MEYIVIFSQFFALFIIRCNFVIVDLCFQQK